MTNEDVDVFYTSCQRKIGGLDIGASKYLYPRKDRRRPPTWDLACWEFTDLRAGTENATVAPGDLLAVLDVILVWGAKQEQSDNEVLRSTYGRQPAAQKWNGGSSLVDPA